MQKNIFLLAVLIGMTAGFLVLAGLWWEKRFIGAYITSDLEIVLTVVVVGVWVGSLSYLMIYLRNKNKNSHEGKASINASIERALSSQMETLRQEINKRIDNIEEWTLDDRKIAELAESAIDIKIQTDMGGNLVEAVGEEVAKASEDYALRKKINNFVIDLFNTSQTRIMDKADMAEKSSNLFKWLGVLLAMLGLIVASFPFISYYFIYQGEYNTEMSLFKHLPFVVPFILLSEVLALIMLRYQSKALEMMRYFSNETTTLCLQRASVLMIINYGSKEAVTTIAMELFKSERNIIMDKGEKTLETEIMSKEDHFVKSNNVADIVNPQLHQ